MRGGVSALFVSDQRGGGARCGKNLQAGLEMLGVLGLDPADQANLPVRPGFGAYRCDVANREVACFPRDVHDGAAVGAFVDNHPLGVMRAGGVLLVKGFNEGFQAGNDLAAVALAAAREAAFGRGVPADG